MFLLRITPTLSADLRTYSKLTVVHYRRRCSRYVARLISGICDFVCLSLCVHALREKRLELSTPNLVHVYSVAGSRHAMTLRSKGQRSRSQGYEACCRRGCACRYDCSGYVCECGSFTSLISLSSSISHHRPSPAWMISASPTFLQDA